MEREMLQHHLKLAEEHVAQGMQHIAKQREIIAKLEMAGQDATTAKELLKTFEASQSQHLADRERLSTELQTAG
jgi:hypothetical protein